MINSFPIRVLVAGGTTTDRDEVAQAIQVDRGFAVVPLASAVDDQVDADALVFIQESALEKTPDEASGADREGLEILPLPMGGAPAFVIARDQVSPGGVNGLSQLPQALRRAVSNSQQAGSAAGQGAGENPAESEEAALAERAMRESQRLAAIGKMTAEIAHEINNPLESVGNLVYLAIREAGMPSRAVEYLRTAERELARIVQISKQTLSFSRESAEPVLVRVTDLLDEVVGLYSRRIGQKKLTVIREYTAAESIPGLPGELRQVFSNLVTNAIEATAPGGTLRLRVRTTLQYQAARIRKGLRISIADTGVGIPESTRHRLGQMFFTTKGESGTGLGLWVTKSVIVRYEGTLQLRSNTGSKHGTVFSIFLPSPEVADSPDQGTTNRAASGNVTEISRHPRFTNPPQRGADPGNSYRKRNG